MLVDAGIDGLNSLNAAPTWISSICENASTIDPCRRNVQHAHAGQGRGERQVEAEARTIIDLGRNGVVVIGTHSVSPEIPPDNYAIYNDFCLAYGDFT